MEHINEKELKQIARNMNGKTIEIKINGVIIAEFTMHKVQCRYNERSGILLIYDKNTNKKFSVETFMAYMLKASENRQIIEIKTDNEESIIIHIILPEPQKKSYKLFDILSKL